MDEKEKVLNQGTKDVYKEPDLDDDFGEEVPDDLEALEAEPPVLDLDFVEPTLDDLQFEEMEAENSGAKLPDVANFSKESITY